MNNHNKMIELLEDNFSLHDADQIYELLDEFYNGQKTDKEEEE